MREADGTVLFKEWLPDLPDLSNPGLVEALNTLPVDRTYKSFAPLSSSGDALAARPLGAIEIHLPASNTRYIYAGQTTSVQRQLTALGTWSNVSSATYSSSTTWEFVQFDELIFATNYADSLQFQTIGAAGFTAASFSDYSTKSRRIGKVNRFVVIGDTNETLNGQVPYRVQWSSIDNPTVWPLPGSATAVANQAGEQYLDSSWGPVNAIVGGDQFGIVMQRGGLNRMTYVGGSIVFQFDKIAGAKGLYLPHSVVEVNGRWYYIAETGVCVTDGVSAQLVGDGKVDRTFFDTAILGGFEERIYGAADTNRKLIKWCFPNEAGGTPRELLVYNYEENRFTHATQTCNCLITAPGDATRKSYIRGFDDTHKAAQFTGTPGTATITTGEIEFSPGAFTRAQGIKPLVDTASVTVALGTRNDQVTTPSFTSETTANSRSGFCDFRGEARYHRARMTLTGTFNAAQGLQFQAEPSGPV